MREKLGTKKIGIADPGINATKKAKQWEKSQELPGRKVRVRAWNFIRAP